MSFIDDFSTFTQSVGNFTNSIATLYDVRERLVQRKVQAELSNQMNNILNNTLAPIGSEQRITMDNWRNAMDQYTSVKQQLLERYNDPYLVDTVQTTVAGMDDMFRAKFAGRFADAELANIQKDFQDTVNSYLPFIDDDDSFNNLMQVLDDKQILSTVSPELRQWADDVKAKTVGTKLYIQARNEGLSAPDAIEQISNGQYKLGTVSIKTQEEKARFLTETIPAMRESATKTLEDTVSSVMKGYKDGTIDANTAYSIGSKAINEAETNGLVDSTAFNMNLSQFGSIIAKDSVENRIFEEIIPMVYNKRSATVYNENIAAALGKLDILEKEYGRYGATKELIDKYRDEIRSMGSSAEGGSSEEKRFGLILSSINYLAKTKNAALGQIMFKNIANDENLPDSVRAEAFNMLTSLIESSYNQKNIPINIITNLIFSDPKINDKYSKLIKDNPQAAAVVTEQITSFLLSDDVAKNFDLNNGYSVSDVSRLKDSVDKLMDNSNSIGANKISFFSKDNIFNITFNTTQKPGTTLTSTDQFILGTIGPDIQTTVTKNINDYIEKPYSVLYQGEKEKRVLRVQFNAQGVVDRIERSSSIGQEGIKTEEIKEKDLTEVENSTLKAYKRGAERAVSVVSGINADRNKNYKAKQSMIDKARAEVSGDSASLYMFNKMIKDIYGDKYK